MTMRRPGDVHVALRPRELFAVLDARRSYHIRQRSGAGPGRGWCRHHRKTHPHSLIRSSFVTSTSWSRSDVKPESTQCPTHVSNTGTPTNPPNAASTALNACAWSATTSPPVSPISSTECRPVVLTPCLEIDEIRESQNFVSSHRDRRRPLVDDPHSRPRWPHSGLVPGEIEYGDRQTVLIHRCGHGVSVTQYADPSRRHAAGPEPAELLSVFQHEGATSAMLWRDD